MRWIELHEDLPDHPKTVSSSRALGIDKDALCGKLARLWTWALEHRKDGFITFEDMETIAEKMRWFKEPELLFEGLCVIPPGKCAGFLEQTEGGYRIHDWHAYTHRYYAQETAREKDRNRKRKAAEIQRNTGGAQAERDRTKTGNPYPTVTHAHTHTVTNTERDAYPLVDPDGSTSPRGEDAPVGCPEEPRGTTGRKQRQAKGEQAQGFAEFWQAYPRNTAKAEAAKAFAKLHPDEALLTVMLRALEAQKRSDQWTRDGGQYIPHARTWLHNRRWEDELTLTGGAPPGEEADPYVFDDP